MPIAADVTNVSVRGCSKQLRVTHGRSLHESVGCSKSVKKMKCCKCQKEVNVKDHSIPARWFGLYEGWTLLRLICSECIKDPKNKNWWKK